MRGGKRPRPRQRARHPLPGQAGLHQPLKLRVGILPPDDRTGPDRTGPRLRGEHLSRCIIETFSRRSELHMADATSMAEHARGRGFAHTGAGHGRLPGPVPEPVAVCRDMNLNFVMGGPAARYGRSRARTGRKKLVQAEHPPATERGARGCALTLRSTSCDPADGTAVASRSLPTGPRAPPAPTSPGSARATPSPGPWASRPSASPPVRS
jgi:hypothetical protein